MRRAQAPGSWRPGSQAETLMAPSVPSRPTGLPLGSSMSALGDSDPTRRQPCGEGLCHLHSSPRSPLALGTLGSRAGPEWGMDSFGAVTHQEGPPPDPRRVRSLTGAKAPQRAGGPVIVTQCARPHPGCHRQLWLQESSRWTPTLDAARRDFRTRRELGMALDAPRTRLWGLVCVAHAAHEPVSLCERGAHL